MARLSLPRQRNTGVCVKIAQIAPLAEAVPPKLYGGTERVVSWLTEALVESGHEVTLFASGDSCTSAKLEPQIERALRLSGTGDPLATQLAMIERVRRRAHEFDVLHFHIDLLQFAICREFAHKSLTTLHGRLDLPDLKPVYRQFPNAALVSISDDQRQHLGVRCNWLDTVHHGLPVDLLRLSTGGDYLAFLGRMSPEKGPLRAIEIAKRAGLPLKMAAKVDRVDRAYFDEMVRPHIDGKQVEYVGEIGDHQKNAFLGGALALLFPIDWCEPFGLVMIEAMATGTPVIAWPHGSVPEVIENGLTGHVVTTIDEAVAAVRHIHRLSRVGVRRRFEQRFTAERMARDYVAVYRDLIETPERGPAIAEKKSLGMLAAYEPSNARPMYAANVLPNRSRLTEAIPLTARDSFE